MKRRITASADAVKGKYLKRRPAKEWSETLDLMIVLDMDPSALPLYDASAPHLQWKRDFADRIAKKAIFDCE